MMAEAAKFNADQGAEIIDINMGAPLKKSAGNTLAGSALVARRIAGFPHFGVCRQRRINTLSHS